MTRAWSSELVPRVRAWGPGWYARKTTRLELGVPTLLLMNGSGNSKTTVGLTVAPVVTMPGFVRFTRPADLVVTPVVAMTGKPVGKATVGLTVNDSIGMAARHQVSTTLPLVVNDSIGMAGVRGPNFRTLVVEVLDSIGMIGGERYTRAMDLILAAAVGMSATPPVYARTLPISNPVSLGMAPTSKSVAAFQLVANDTIGMAATHSYANEFAVGLFEDVAAGSDFEGAHPWSLPAGQAVITTDQAFRGTKSLALLTDGTNSYSIATLRNYATKWPVTPGETISVKFKTRHTADFGTTGVTEDSKLRFGDADASSAHVYSQQFGAATYPASDVWVVATGSFVVPPGVRNLVIDARSRHNTGTVYFDEIEIRRSTLALGMAGREAYTRTLDLVVNDSIGMAVTSRSGPASFTIGPSANTATDPDTDDPADWAVTTNLDPIELVTNGPAALGPVMLKVVRAFANSYGISMPLRDATGRGRRDTAVIPGQRTTLTADVARVPGSPGGNVSIGIFVRHINSSGAIMTTVIDGQTTASYSSSNRTDDNVVTLTASAVAPVGAVSVDSGIYLTLNTQPIGDGYYASNIRYVTDNGLAVIDMIGKPVGKATVGLAVTPTVTMAGREAYARTLPLVINDSITMAGREAYTRTLPITVDDQINMAVTSRSVAAFQVVANDQIGMAGREAYSRAVGLAVTPAIGMAGAERYAATLPLAVFPGIIMSSGQLATAVFAVVVNDSIGMAGRDQEAAAFAVVVNDSIGMAGRNMVTTTLPLVVNDSIGMGGLPRHGAQFGLSITPAVGMAGRNMVTTTVQLIANDTITMAGRDQEAATFQVIANDQVTMTARHQVTTTLPVVVNDSIGMAAVAGQNPPASFSLSVAIATAFSGVGITPITEVNTARTNQPVPSGYRWYRVRGRGAGAGGGKGRVQSFVSNGGGGGGGGGGYFDTGWRSTAELGGTYSASPSPSYTPQETDGLPVRFFSGGVDLWAYGGTKGTTSTSNAQLTPGGAGGTVSVTGTTLAVNETGGTGGNGGQSSSGIRDGKPGGDTTLAGPGGGGGAYHPNAFNTDRGGNGGDSAAAQGGEQAGNTSGLAGFPGNNGGEGNAGGGGGGGGINGGNARSGADGGVSGAGGGAGSGGTGGGTSNGGQGAPGELIVEFR